jgi:hypothetical protein
VSRGKQGEIDMTRRIRAGLVAIGLAVVVPFVAVQPASAASYNVDKFVSLTFVNTNGAPRTCTVEDDATHNNDNANQPYTLVVSGEGGDLNDCIDRVLLTVTVSYKDRDGVRRTVSSSGFSTSDLTVQGTYSAISTSVRAQYLDCDASQSATCEVTAVANPK